jgi:transposase-like protein
VNKLLLEYVDQHGGNVTHLANELEGDISLAGLRRRLRSARNGGLLGSTSLSRKRGSKDPERVAAAAEKIQQARNVSPTSYGNAVREVYQSGVSLSAVAKALGCSYFTLWTAGSHN